MSTNQLLFIEELLLLYLFSTKFWKEKHEKY